MWWDVLYEWNMTSFQSNGFMSLFALMHLCCKLANAACIMVIMHKVACISAITNNYVAWYENPLGFMWHLLIHIFLDQDGNYAADNRPVNSPHKWPVTWKMFPFDDIIMSALCLPTVLKHQAISIHNAD